MSLWLSNNISVQRINGKPCLVRHRKQKRPSISVQIDSDSVVGIGLDLIGQAFSSSIFGMDKDKDKGKSEDRSTHHQGPKEFSQHDPHAHGQPMMPPGMSGMPAPGIYQQGNRQLALLPKVPTGPMMQHGGFGYPQQFMHGAAPQMMPNMMPMMANMGNMGFGGFNSKFDNAVPATAPAVEITTVVPTNSIVVTRHLCANCGNLRSRRYQAEHSLSMGEDPPVSFCRKCEKGFRSTDSAASEISIELPSGKRNKKITKGKKMETRKMETEKELSSTMHMCAQCGNPRSRKYQAKNPLKTGEVPPVSYCGKCQKEVTSSEDSDASIESADEVETYVSKRKNGYEKERSYYHDRRIKVHIPRSGHEDPYVESEDDQLDRTTTKKNQKSRRTEDYITADEEPEDRGRRRHPRYRHMNMMDNEGPPSPLVALHEPIRPTRTVESLKRAGRRTRSGSRPGESKRRGQHEQNSERHEYDNQESSDLEELAERTYRAYLSDGAPLHEEDRPPKQAHQGPTKAQNRRGRARTQNLKEGGSDDSSTKFREASRSRRQERGSLTPTEAMRVHPEIQEKLKHLKDDEMIVVTERYVYRPQRATAVPEEQIRDERTERRNEVHRPSQQFFIGSEDSAEYYPEEWGRGRGVRGHVERQASYQRILPRDLDDVSLLTGAGSSVSSHEQHYYDGRKAPRFPPHAPTPPSIPSISTATSGSTDTYSQSSRSTADYPPRHEPAPYRKSRLPGEYQPSSSSEASLPPAQQPRQPRQPRSLPRVRRRRASRYRAPYVRDANSGGSEGVVVVSRSPSRERAAAAAYGFEEDPAEQTANDRIERRRVSFGPDQVRMISRESVATAGDGLPGARSRVGRGGRERDREYGYTGERYGN